MADSTQNDKRYHELVQLLINVEPLVNNVVLFDFPGLLEDMQEEIRRACCRSARSMLAMTCRREYNQTRVTIDDRTLLLLRLAREDGLESRLLLRHYLIPWCRNQIFYKSSFMLPEYQSYGLLLILNGAYLGEQGPLMAMLWQMFPGRVKSHLTMYCAGAMYFPVGHPFSVEQSADFIINSLLMPWRRLEGEDRFQFSGLVTGMLLEYHRHDCLALGLVQPVPDSKYALFKWKAWARMFASSMRLWNRPIWERMIKEWRRHLTYWQDHVATAQWAMAEHFRQRLPTLGTGDDDLWEELEEFLIYRLFCALTAKGQTMEEIRAVFHTCIPPGQTVRRFLLGRLTQEHTRGTVFLAHEVAQDAQNDNVFSWLEETYESILEHGQRQVMPIYLMQRPVGISQILEELQTVGMLDSQRLFGQSRDDDDDNTDNGEEEDDDMVD